MRVRVSYVFAATLGVVFLCLPTPAVRADDGQTGVQGGEPPSIVYRDSRSSSKWVALTNGSQVAIDKGVAWQGVEVYISLSFDLVAVDEKTGKTLWHRDIGAFWNSVGFEHLKKQDGVKTWAVVLRRVPPPDTPVEPRGYYDLRTGKTIDVPQIQSHPSGARLKLRAAWHGEISQVAEKFHLLVSTAENWSIVRARLWNEDAMQAEGEVDFTKEVVLVVSYGNGWNCKGVVCREVWEDEKRLLVRVDGSYYQTLGGGQKVRPWGAFVLPRHSDMAYVVERDRQNLIGGPSIWKETWRVAKLPKPADELTALPERSEDDHAGWER